MGVVGGKDADLIWTDADVAGFFKISVKTLQRRLKRPVAGELDLKMARPGVIGGHRYWVRAEVVALAVGERVKARGEGERMK